MHWEMDQKRDIATHALSLAVNQEQNTASYTQLYSHTHQTQVAHATSWQFLTKHSQHNCINNSKQSTVKEAIFWQSTGFY